MYFYPFIIVIKPCERMIRFKVREEEHQHKTFVITSTMIQEVFKEKIENRKLLGFKMIKAKVTILQMRTSAL